MSRDGRGWREGASNFFLAQHSSSSPAHTYTKHQVNLLGGPFFFVCPTMFDGMHACMLVQIVQPWHAQRSRPLLRCIPHFAFRWVTHAHFPTFTFFFFLDARCCPSSSAPYSVHGSSSRHLTIRAGRCMAFAFSFCNSRATSPGAEKKNTFYFEG